MLSDAARELLAVLKMAGAYGPGKARTQAWLAARMNCSRREIVDLAGELLAAGILCLATCGRPAGCYLLRPGMDDLAPARAYRDGLQRRAVSVMERRQAVERALARAETIAAEAGQGGQMALFGAGGGSSVIR